MRTHPARQVTIVFATGLVFLGCGFPQAFAQSRFPSDVLAAEIPDDSESSRQTALARLRARPHTPVCAGERRDVSTRLGTRCGTREFDAPALLAEPKVQWTNHPGYWTNHPFMLVGDRLYSASCLDNRVKEGGTFAIDTKTGKVLWRDRKICEGVEQGTWEDLTARVFALPNQTLLVATVGTHTRYRQFQHDMNTGRILAQDKKPLKWANIELIGAQFVSRVRSKPDTSYVAARSLELSEPQWKVEEFVGKCPRGVSQSDCDTSYNMSHVAALEGILYVSAARKDHPGPAARELHAIDMKTGSVLWRHRNLPVARQTQDGPKLADDGSPMLAGGKVILRFTAGERTFFKALNAKDGRELWSTLPIPGRFKEEWLPRNENRRPVLSQEVQSHLISGNVLLALVWGGEEAHSDVWAYDLTDGRALWRKPVTFNGKDARLAAAAGGVVYLVNRTQLTALETESGTLLWAFKFSSRQIDVDDPDYLSFQGGHMSQGHEHSDGEIFWPDNWMIGPDGGFYIASPFNLTKLR